MKKKICDTCYYLLDVAERCSHPLSDKKKMKVSPKRDTCKFWVRRELLSTEGVMNVESELKKMDLDELSKVRNLCDSLIMERLYGLKGSLGGSLLATEFSKKRSYIVVKNDIPMGRYDLLIRPPEHSTLKLDLEVPELARATKQVRVWFTRAEWKKITSL